ncbi:hypothetical protein, partial [Streptomyces sp. NPDC057910]|uniref:hypothetical protein n=1 Tax=Streptomyces sp. NPDC057910 TaxID=3346278 RepID=UPI0036E3EFBA
MPELIFQRTAPSCPYCRTTFTAGTYWPDLAEADHLYQQNDGKYLGPNPDHPALPDDTYPQNDERGQEQTGTHTGPDTAATELNDQAHDVWATGRPRRPGRRTRPTRQDLLIFDYGLDAGGVSSRPVPARNPMRSSGWRWM